MVESVPRWFAIAFAGAAILIVLLHLLIRRTSYVLELRGRKLAVFLTLGGGQFRVYCRRTIGGGARDNAGISLTRGHRHLPFNPHRSPNDKRYARLGNFTLAWGEHAPKRYWLASVPYWLPAACALIAFALVWLYRGA